MQELYVYSKTVHNNLYNPIEDFKNLKLVTCILIKFAEAFTMFKEGIMIEQISSEFFYLHLWNFFF